MCDWPIMKRTCFSSGAVYARILAWSGSGMMNGLDDKDGSADTSFIKLIFRGQLADD